MWSAIVFFAIIVCSQAERYNVMIQSPAASLPSTTRIIGGSQTTIEQYPYTVQILFEGRGLQCGGSLLTARHVLSAAHCFIYQNGVYYDPRSFTIRAGSTNLNTGGTVVEVSTIIPHKGFDLQYGYNNDLAVVVLASELTLSDQIGIAALPPQGHEVADDSPVIHVGWGITKAGYTSVILNEVTVYVVNQAVCATRYREIPNKQGQLPIVTYNMICAGVLNVGGRDACQGDSGGPLLHTNVIVGITSWGYNCAEPDYPGVNTRVSSYTNWIETTVRKYNASTRLESMRSLVLALFVAYVIL